MLLLHILELYPVGFLPRGHACRSQFGDVFPVSMAQRNSGSIMMTPIASYQLPVLIPRLALNRSIGMLLSTGHRVDHVHRTGMGSSDASMSFERHTQSPKRSGSSNMNYTHYGTHNSYGRMERTLRAHRRPSSGSFGRSSKLAG